MVRFIRSRRALGLIAAAVILAASPSGSALAVDPGEPAEPPPPNLEGVVFDATLSVTFHDVEEAGGAALAGATVQVAATRDGSPIVAAEGTTDELGTAAFDGLPRATAGPPVLLAVVASIEGPAPGSCGGTWFKSAVVDGIESSIGGVLDLPATLLGGIGGACPPDLEGVDFSGQLTIVVVGAGGAAQGGLQVYVDALLDGGESIWVDSRTTDAEGRVTFTDLPRPEPGGPSISWHAFASHRYEVVDDCTFLVVSEGSVEVPAGADPVETELVVEILRYGEGCEDPAPGSPMLTGVIIDGAGTPVPGSSFLQPGLQIRQEREDGGVWMSSAPVGEDGTFALPVQPWGTTDSPSPITLSVIGPETRVETDDLGCRIGYALVGSLTIAAQLDDDPVLAPVEVVLAEGPAQSVCSETGAPGAGGSPTLPPTDSGPSADAGVAFVAPALLAQVAVVTAVLVAVGLWRPRRT